MEEIRALARTKTVLLISHRLANVVDADCVYVLDEGQVAESGTHQELLGRGGAYRRLWDAQAGPGTLWRGGNHDEKAKRIPGDGCGWSGLVRPLAGFMAAGHFAGAGGAFVRRLPHHAAGDTPWPEALGLEIPFSLGLSCLAGCWCLRWSGDSCAMGSRPATTSSPLSCWRCCGTRSSGPCGGCAPPSWRAGTGATSSPSSPRTLNCWRSSTPTPSPRIAIAVAVHGGRCACSLAASTGLLGLLALAAYAVVGVVMPLVTSRLSGDDGMQFRHQLGGSLQLCAGQPAGPIRKRCNTARASSRLEEMDERTAALCPGRGADEAHRRPQPGGDEHRHTWCLTWPCSLRPRCCTRPGRWTF